MSYDSAQMLTAGYAKDIGGIFTYFTSPPLELYLFPDPNDQEWHGGDEVGSDFLVSLGVPPNVNASASFFQWQLSKARKLGRFPIGCITDGQGEPDEPLDGGLWNFEFTGIQDENSQPRVGQLHFLPNAQFLDGTPGKKGFIPKADEWWEPYSMRGLVYEHAEMVHWSDESIYILDGESGPDTGGAAYIDATISGDIQPDFSPTVGHILRMIPIRYRITYQLVSLPSGPPPPQGVTIDLGLLADLSAEDIQTLQNSEPWGAVQYQGATGLWFFSSGSFWGSHVFAAQTVPPPQHPGDTFTIQAPQDDTGSFNIYYLIHGNVFWP